MLKHIQMFVEHTTQCTIHSINICDSKKLQALDFLQPSNPSKTAWGGGGPGTCGRTLVQQHLDEGHAQAEDVAFVDPRRRCAAPNGKVLGICGVAGGR